MILGRKWLAEHKIWLNMADRKLVWPEERSMKDRALLKVQKIIPRRLLLRPEPKTVHQKDADRRDAAMETEILQEKKANIDNEIIAKVDVRIGKAPTHTKIGTKKIRGRENITSKPGQTIPIKTDASGMTEAKTRARNLRVMKKELTKPIEEPIEPEYEPPQDIRDWSTIVPAKIDIAMIGGVGFTRVARKKDTQLFTTTLYELDKLIDEKWEERQVEDEQRTQELITAKLPKCYASYRDVFSKAESDKLAPHGDHDLKIELVDEPKLGFTPLRKQTLEELVTCKKYLIDNLNKGFLSDSNAPHAAPILFARKGDGTLRFCVDYRHLNSHTRKDQYPLPLIDETLEQISKAKIFTKLDIRQAFHRIRIREEDTDLTTFRTRYGSFKYNVVPFGLTNGPATFQRWINSLLFEHLDVFTSAYLDDILIYSDNVAEHEMHVKKILDILRANGLQADIKKCEFEVIKIKYLEFIISTNDITANPEKIAVIRE